MERRSHAVPVCIVLAAAFALSTAGCAKLKARDDLNKGVDAYKNSQFDAAIDYFKDAEANDPKLMNARLFLAQAYAQQYIPGAPSPENKRYGEQAIAEWKGVLETEPNNLTAIGGIGSMLYNMASTPFNRDMMEQAKTYQQKALSINPNDSTAYYWVGVLDYWIAYRTNAQLRSDYNQKAKKPIKPLDALPPTIRDQFIQQEGPTVDEGITDLQKAIQIKPDYANAMAYLNLLLRQKADMETGSDARQADEKQADDLLEKVKEINQKEMTAPQSGSSQ
ncbi:MAG TPA: tetratricopeptide repeat protein [Candidatus Acidoferrales bacterium]|nr:tetratricopeptide repeat protein [Candidatus Acidoferrales bacterium]